MLRSDFGKCLGEESSHCRLASPSRPFLSRHDAYIVKKVFMADQRSSGGAQVGEIFSPA